MARSRQRVEYEITVSDIIGLINEMFDINLPPTAGIRVNPATDISQPNQVVVTATVFAPPVPSPHQPFPPGQP